jgi:hypothetical protein
MDNNKIIKIGIISVIAIITLAVLVGVLIFTGKDKEVDISPVQEIPDNIPDNEDEFVSTDENPYDTSIEDEREANKEIVTSEDLKKFKEGIVPLIAEAKWKEALDYVNEYMESHTYKSEEGKIVQAYQNDLTVMVQMSVVPEDMFDEVFTSFEAPETFLACMIYYPPKAKIAAFLSLEGLVPTTELNDVVIYELKEVQDDDLLKDINLNFNDQYKRVLSQEFDVEGLRYIAYMAETNDGKYHMYKIEAISEGSYYMTVNEWVRHFKGWQ